MKAPRLRTPEWLEARRQSVTGTDIPAILGLSPYRSEGDVAREKAGVPVVHDEATQRRLRIGTALEDVIRAEDTIEHGYPLRRVNRLVVSAVIPWAVASLDFERRDGTIVEAKSSRDRRWNDGLPREVEAQVQWQMGVSGRERAHVAALRYGSTLECYDLDANPDDFAGMVVIATDFRRRLEEGGPFSESIASVNSAYTPDPGATLIADQEIDALVRAYIDARERATQAESDKDEAALGIKTRMGPMTELVGDGYKATWRPSRSRVVTDWTRVAESYRTLIETLTEAGLVSSETWSGIESIYTRDEPGARPLVVRRDKEARE